MRRLSKARSVSLIPIWFLAITIMFASVYIETRPANAQEQRAAPASTCQAIAKNPYGRFLNARSTSDLTSQNKLGPGEVQITFIGHSTFLLQDASGLTLATDYADWAGIDETGSAVVPDIVTMNNAHITHFSPQPNPDIGHVFRGWPENGKPAAFNVQIADTVIRNVTTDLSTFGGTRVPDGNSIFVFEMGGLCIGHLGHLHYRLIDDHIAKLGRLDVLMVPIDGGYTMNIKDMTRVVKRLNASVILPMHAFSAFSLDRFLAEMDEEIAVERSSESSLVLSLNTLPQTPKVINLTPQNGP